MMRITKAILAGGAALAASLPASAHMGFILPDSFDYAACNRLGASASFSDHFPSPEVALIVPEFRLTGPQGPVSLDRANADHAVTRLEASLETPGTYRLTTGERLGRVGQIARLDGAYVRLEGDVAPPEGAELLSLQTATVSEAYFSCGGAKTGIDTAPAGQLGVTPGQDEDTSGQTRTFQVTFSGAPLQAGEAELIPAYASYSSHAEGRSLTVSPDGEIRLEDLAPGVYALLVRHIAPAPEGAQSAVRSYSTTITFAVGEAHAAH